MVYAAAFCPCSTDLTSKAFADSKTLTEARRETLLSLLQADTNIGYRCESLSAAFISGRMLARDRDSLNALANDSTARLIAGVLAAGVNLREAFVDTVGDADKHKARLAAQFPAVQFTVCPKADSLFPIVSAASIVAKVTRDRQLRDYVSPEQPARNSRIYGCGYPGDVVTKAWLEAAAHPVFGFPCLVRFSWATCTPVLESAGAVGVRWECEAEDEGSQQTLSWRPAAARKAADVRHSFFRTRRLARVDDGFLPQPAPAAC